MYGPYHPGGRIPPTGLPATGIGGPEGIPMGIGAPEGIPVGIGVGTV